MDDGAGVGLPSGRCSMAVSPDESYVLFAVVGTPILESDDGGQSWPGTTPIRSPQGRIPFVATNKRGGANYDLWFGDVRLHRGTCTTPHRQRPAARNGATHRQAGRVFTRTAERTTTPAISPLRRVWPRRLPIVLLLRRWRVPEHPDCQPWLSHAGVDAANGHSPCVVELHDVGCAARRRAAGRFYLGNQDNGTFGSTNAGAPSVTWNSQTCCDGFDSAGDGTRALTSVCCFAPRATILLNSAPGLTTARRHKLERIPQATCGRSSTSRADADVRGQSYVISTTTGVFLTTNIGASPIVWTQLGAASSPAGACGVSGRRPPAERRRSSRRAVAATGPAGHACGAIRARRERTWQQVRAHRRRGFGVFAVDHGDPQRLIASHLGGAAGPRMVMTLNGGTTWSRFPRLTV